jgi:hypothetical protein
MTPVGLIKLYCSNIDIRLETPSDDEDIGAF